MRPLSDEIPKPMLPVGDRPLVEHVLDTAVEAGAEELVVVVGYGGARVRDHFGDRFRGRPVEYAVQERQRGTAHAIEAAAEHLDGPFLVLNGDSLYDSDAVAELVAEGPSVAAYSAENPSNYGVLDVEEGVVTGIVEKPDSPPTDLVNAGAYVFPGHALDWLPVPESERGEHEITDVLARTVEECEVTPVALDRWMDVGRPWELLEATSWVLENLDRNVAGEVTDGARLDGDVVVESGATVGPGVVVEGPVLVRSGAEVGPNAYVRGPTVVGSDAEVGHGVEVKRSVLMAGASASHLSYVGDSVLAPDVNFGAGTTVANLRHDDEPVHVTVKGERVSTGRRKFGVVAGPGAKTGIDTCLNAGVTLSAEARTDPGEVVTRDR
jgi:bifunctional UDP-N-acetylglucosamine pyrophosphorylase/glucosamine-1-phosphate N-acetyltransferase